MSCRRYLILGNGGSGKSHFADRLADNINTTATHLDDYYWQDNGNAVAPEIWSDIHQTLISPKNWIIEGTQMRCLNERIKASDIIVFLDLPVWICIARIIKKYWYKENRYGFPRQKGVINNIKWLLKFQFKYRKKIVDEITSSGKPFHIIKNKKQADYLLRTLAALPMK